jgi:carboxyl-terminal processing protease
MNKKISAGVCISLIAIACTVTFVVTWTVSFNMYNDIIPVTQRDEINSKLQEIDSFLRNNFLGEIDNERVSFGIFSGYISGIGDKNTVYMTAEQYVRHRNQESGQLITSGIMPERDASGYIKAGDVYPGSSAQSQGVQRGDIITEIDGVGVLEAGAEAAMRLLEGEEYTRVDVTILRDGELLPHSLIRQATDIESVHAEVVNGVGFARITTFNSLTTAQWSSALTTFAEADVRALLIDLRGNSSDFYEPVSDMADSLISAEAAEVLAFAERRSGVRRDVIVVSGESPFADTPVIILTDSMTSGAGELMTAVLRAHGGAETVGGITAGNAYVQQTQKLKDDSAIRVTVARIMLTSAPDYAESGLAPDYAEESGVILTNVALIRDMELAEIPDPQIRKAFEIIETR